ncbi:MAG: tryptophan synthase subunit alpha [Candidatus Latescibacteria bacterium]|nr:tryptophan synthase subunit alpha [Candidatus Latescibacterota bacterium]
MKLDAYIRKRLESSKVLVMTHLIAGFPSLAANWEMLEEMGQAGVDLVELQMPFSEPVADGPTFARANQHALAQGLKLDQYFGLMEKAAKTYPFPLLMMGYYNTVFRLGHQAFCETLHTRGGVGFILPDLPVEEYGDLFAHSQRCELHPIMLMAPTNTDERLARIGRHAAGMVYAVARKGVTGGKTELAGGTYDFVARCRRATDQPIGMGFGLRQGEDVRRLQGQVEVAIVGSALLEAWERGGRPAYRALLAELVAART